MSAATTAQPEHIAARGRYLCGPVRLCVRIAVPGLGDALHGLLGQYDAPWPEHAVDIHALVQQSPGDSIAPQPSPRGDYLQTRHLRIDRVAGVLHALGVAGTVMRFDQPTGSVTITLPPAWDAFPARRSETIEEIEQQFLVVLSRAWQCAGWAPVHAGTLLPPGEETRGDRCALVCAPAGTGKTTTVGTLLRLGWRTLGDDKTLLRINPDGHADARPLAHRFHLHPAMARWFPEARDIGRWPRYSRWTEKRAVPIESVWPGRLAHGARPAALVRLERAEWAVHGGRRPQGGIEIEPLDAAHTLATLLRQVVIPTDPRDARQLTTTLARAAASMQGLIVRIAENAIADHHVIARLDAALREAIA